MKYDLSKSLNPRRLRETKICTDGHYVVVDISARYVCRDCGMSLSKKGKILLKELLKSDSEEGAQRHLKALKRNKRKVLKGDLSGMTCYNITDEFGSTNDKYYDETS